MKCIPSERARIIKEQQEDVLSRLSDSELDLSFIPKPVLEDIHDDDCAKLNMDLSNKIKKNKSAQLF